MEKYSGKVKQVFVKELPEPKSFVHEGKTITNTHRHALLMDDDNWYGFGESDKDVFLAKDMDDDDGYKILGEGSEVTIRYTLSDCGKYRNSKKSKLVVDDFVVGKKWEPGNGKGESRGNTGAFNLVGIKVGHSMNAAVALKSGKFTGFPELYSLAKELAVVSQNVEKAYKEENPSLSPKDIGAASGNAVLVACAITDDASKVQGLALSVLKKVVPALTDHVETLMPKPEPKKEEPKQEDGFDDGSFDANTPDDDFDDDIPF